LGRLSVYVNIVQNKLRKAENIKNPDSLDKWLVINVRQEILCLVFFKFWKVFRLLEKTGHNTFNTDLFDTGRITF